MKKILLIVAAFFAAALLPASAQTPLTFKTQPLSQTWLFTGLCDGTDQVYNWTLSGGAGLGSWHVPPWLPYPIGITKLVITKVSGGPHVWFMPGNNSQGDAMGRMSPSQDQAKIEYSSGMLSVFPSTYTARPTDYIDLHGSCTNPPGMPAGSPPVPIQIWMDIYYVEPVNPPPPPTPVCTTFDTWSTTDKSSNIALSNANLTASGNGANAHSLVRAAAGIAPNTLVVHYEATLSGVGSAGVPILVLGMQDGSAPTNIQLGGSGTGFGHGYNAANAYDYTANFTPAGGASSIPLANGTYGFDYDSFTQTLKITGPGGLSLTKTAGSAVTLFPGVSMYGSTSGSATLNPGSSSFVYPVPAGAQAGICQ